MLFHKVSRHVAQRNPRKSFLLYNQIRGKSVQNWKRPTMDEYLGVVHQIISPILNSEFTNIPVQNLLPMGHLAP